MAPRAILVHVSLLIALAGAWLSSLQQWSSHVPSASGENPAIGNAQALARRFAIHIQDEMDPGCAPDALTWVPGELCAVLHSHCFAFAFSDIRQLVVPVVCYA